MNSDDPLICKVSIPNTYADAYDYACSKELALLGARVMVPFRSQHRLGIVIDYTSPKKPRSLKAILEVPCEQPLFQAMDLQWLKWLAKYYHAPLSEILALAIPKALKDFKTSLNYPQEIWVKLTQEAIEQKYTIPSRQKKLQELIATLHENPKDITLKELKSKGFSQSLIEKAKDSHFIAYEYREATLSPSNPTPVKISLNEEQHQAVSAFDYSQFKVYLLQGVTGSGKTEVYIEAIQAVIQKGRQVLLLVPEIGLTPALLIRLQSRCSTPISVFHSNLTEKQRYRNWLDVYHGKSSLIIGTRSAIFAPIKNLGLVIIDEEHDASFKQIEGVRYSAKDAVMMRAKMHNVPVILGSATPSLETFYHAQHHRYQRLSLHKKALTNTPLSYHLIDLRRQKIQHGIADETLHMIQKHLEKNQQVLVFINRRGFSPLLFCHDCGCGIECQRCDVHLTFHRTQQKLICHHCGWSCTPPKQCPKCFSHQLLPVGVGTEQVADFLTHHFDCPVLRFDRDVIKNRPQLEEGLKKIEAREVNLIVATQMLAKGHHFSHLSLVVVVDGDSGFYQADFRALERLGQMLTQVSGRAGRAEIPGEVCIQTHLPKHPLLLTLIQKGYEPFMLALLEQREAALLPPYCFLALVRVQGKSPGEVIEFIKNTAKQLKDLPLEVWGPSPAPLERKANIHRWQLVIKSKNRPHLHAQLDKLSQWMATHTPKGLRWFIEVDPHDWSA